MVIVTEHLSSSALRWLQERVNCYYETTLHRDPERLYRLLGRARGLIVRNQTYVSEELLIHAPRLRVVGRLGAGLDNLDRLALQQRGIPAVYAPGANANAVAEACLLYMLALARRLLLADQSVRQGLWERHRFPGSELRGKIVGVIGLGAVGERLAELCSHLGCQVLVHSARAKPGWENVSLPDLLVRADYISVNCALTPQTLGLIGPSEIGLLKPSAFIINTARGGIIDEDALYEALRQRRIAGAALDVRQFEPPGQDRFSELNNVILTPHLAGWTREAQELVCQTVVEDVWRVLQDQPPRFPVPTLG
ncbi:MAG: hydroxyacid dehydrogenase [Bacillota bacterium]|jgi:phosphoglycerate dehydrogenase-like enzyme